MILKNYAKLLSNNLTWITGYVELNWTARGEEESSGSQPGEQVTHRMSQDTYEGWADDFFDTVFSILFFKNSLFGRPVDTCDSWLKVTINSHYKLWYSLSIYLMIIFTINYLVFKMWKKNIFSLDFPRTQRWCSANHHI